MFVAVFVALLLPTCAEAQGKGQPSIPVTSSPARHVLTARRRRAVLSAPERAEDLYSPRARRRIAAYLRMRMLELRAEGLERAADVIEGRSPLKTLFEEDGVPTPYL